MTQELVSIELTLIMEPLDSIQTQSQKPFSFIFVDRTTLFEDPIFPDNCSRVGILSQHILNPHYYKHFEIFFQ